MIKQIRTGILILMVTTLAGGFELLLAQTSISDSREGNFYQQGVSLFNQNKYAAARKSFEAYLKADPSGSNVADALYFQAFCGLSLQHADAEGLFERFLTEYPNHPRALTGYYEVGNFYYRQENYSKAAEFYAKAKPERLPTAERPEFYFHWGFSLFTLKKFEEALPHFNLVKKSDGEYKAPAYYYAGYIYFQLKQYDNALTDLRLAGESDGYETIVPELVAATLYRKNDFKELISYTKPYLTGSKEAKNVDQIALYAAEAYYEQKDYAKALPYYEQYMKPMRKKPVAPVLFRISYSYMKAKQPAKAIENFKYVALEKDEIGQAASYYLGDLYIMEGNKSFAVSAYQQAADSEYDEKVKERAMFKLAQVHMDLGNYEQAIPVLEKYMREYPQSSDKGDAQDMIAEAYVNSSNYDRALAYFEKVGLGSQRIKKAYQKAAFLNATQLFNSGKFYESVQMFDNSLRYPLDPELEIDAWFWKGEAFSTGKKYEDAIGSYTMALQKGRRSNSLTFHKANYGIGYALFNLNRYPEAANYFKAYVNNRRPDNNRDAEVRLADCLYAQKKYDEALTFYQQAGSNGFKERDYLLYQRGVILGFQNRKEDAKRELDQVTKAFPNSRYADDATFQSAQLDFEAGDYARAKAGFTSVISKYPNSGFIPYALVRRASSSYNLKEYPSSANDYKKVLEEYPQHTLANSALLGLQEVLALMGKSNEVDQYIALYKKANPDDKALESVEYERARNLYFEQKYTEAVNALRAYRVSYPQSINAAEALYYVGESYYRLNQTAPALEAYYQLIGDMQTVSPAKVYQRIGALEYSNKNYPVAIKYWHKLRVSSDSKRDLYTAREGLMESHFAANSLDSSQVYAERILGDDKVAFNAQNKAGTYMGKIAFERNQYGAALDEFLAVVNAAKDINAAESQYYVGLIQYRQKEYKRSLETLFGLNKSYAVYENWLGKSFLLIADNYLALNELFQAKATLESVITNSPIPELKEAARAKLKEVDKRETEAVTQKDTDQSPIKKDSTSQKRN
ncbi:tetratricopeptide repeat protein [Imperialibacter roseus]|uniref:Tetratricopeptide repeat protein n=1 Tax=Imperialibacter roseus TaxID=1324217 RepID=A0ABZ0IY13_9BACT|nr:tetratricopeptide repeat protein [Imperialibacter roseus]WOK09260.1 tetratricopeptide repeat protein [Imperialibacter roseus]